jgi:Amt family ammonium transporter
MIHLVGPLSGAVVGLVVITPACGYVHTFGAMAMGVLGGSLIFLAMYIKCKYINGKGILRHFDDALDVFVCHGLGGTLGAFLTGVFVSKDVNPYGNDGLIFGSWGQIPPQMLSFVVTVVWSGGWTALILLALKVTVGLRHAVEVEEVGVDVVEHKQVAYRLGLNSQTISGGDGGGGGEKSSPLMNGECRERNGGGDGCVATKSMIKGNSERDWLLG